MISIPWQNRLAFIRRICSLALVVAGSTIFFAQPVEAATSTSSTSTNVQHVKRKIVLPRYTADTKAASGKPFSFYLTGSPHLLAASQRIKVHGSISAVIAWYSAHMPQYGYVQTSVDKANDLLSFNCKNDPNLNVAIKLTQPSYGSNVVDVQYEVTLIQTPTRPSDSFVPSDTKQVVIRYEPASDHSVNSWATRKLTDKYEIVKLTNAINGLSVDIRTNVNEPAALSGGAELKFVAPSGQVREVMVDFQQNQVKINHVTLFDMQNAVWQLVSGEMGYLAN